MNCGDSSVLDDDSGVMDVEEFHSDISAAYKCVRMLQLQTSESVAVQHSCNILVAHRTALQCSSPALMRQYCIASLQVKVIRGRHSDNLEQSSR